MIAVITVSVTDTSVALAPPTVTPVTPKKLVPVMVTTVPPKAGPDTGETGVPVLAIAGMP